MRLNKTQCKVVHLAQGNPWDQFRLGMNRSRAVLGKRTSGSWWVRLDMLQPAVCAGLHTEPWGSRKGEFCPSAPLR